jgi:4-amino-4-deoxy-L-arabinose transferase-like glycosyltransferase
LTFDSQHRHLILKKSRKTQLVLVAITVATLAPFLNKAFHVDDPLFIWMARQIVRHPLDPYGFAINWSTFPQPAFERMQNPPLCSYYIALVGRIFGWNEPALHSAFLLWPVMAAIGTFEIARRLAPGGSAFSAGLLSLFTPVFMISATNVMCDVMMLALWIWSVVFWLRGLDENRAGYLVVSATLVACALLTKYFGVALVPLLAVYTIIRERSWRCWRLLFLVIPIACLALFEWWTKSRYGRGLFFDAIFYTRTVGKASLPAQFLIGFSFFGGSISFPLLFLWNLSARRIALGGFIIAIIAIYFLMPITPDWQLGPNELFVRAEAGVFAGCGIFVIALAVAELFRSKTAESWMLCLWIIGTLIFAAYFNWSITARTTLPAVPAIAVLIVRRFSVRLWQLASMAVISLLLTTADFCYANTVRTAVYNFADRFRDEPGKIWFQSHWGFHYYMEQTGAISLNTRDSVITSGDVMIVPANNVDAVPISPERIFPPEEQTFPVLPWVSVMEVGTGAGFYSHVRGPLPWAVDHVPPQKYYIARFR